MNYAIIGSGQIGTALAKAFARRNIPVGIANTRGPQTLASLAKELGPSVVPQSIEEAYKADVIFIAVPFPAHNALAKRFEQWNGKTLVDVTNTLDLTPQERDELGGQLSSEVVAEAFVGAKLVKAFNHLPATRLGNNPPVTGQRQVVFVSSNDADASAAVAAVAVELGFAPIEIGRLDQGGVALHVVDGQPGGLLFQNLVKFG